MDAKQLREHVIRPVLLSLGLHSEAAEVLLLGTACQESHLEYIKQLGNGPAWGIYQMEPDTHGDIWNNFLKYKPDLAAKVREFNLPGLYVGQDYKEMAGNLYYATAMCRVHYFRRPEALPPANDVLAQAAYWKKHYNTVKGKGTTTEFVQNFRRYGRD